MQAAEAIEVTAEEEEMGQRRRWDRGGDGTEEEEMGSGGDVHQDRPTLAYLHTYILARSQVAHCSSRPAVACSKASSRFRCGAGAAPLHFIV